MATRKIKEAVAPATKRKTAEKPKKDVSTTKAPRAKKATPVPEAPVKKTRAKKTVEFSAKTPKQIADDAGEPYVSVVSIELDPDNIGNGAFELDWNDKFITNLVRQGYKGKTDADLVDQWFNEVCKNVISENYEQWEANQPRDERLRVINRKDIGGGKTEVS